MFPVNMSGDNYASQDSKFRTEHASKENSAEVQEKDLFAQERKIFHEIYKYISEARNSEVAFRRTMKIAKLSQSIDFSQHSPVYPEVNRSIMAQIGNCGEKINKLFVCAKDVIERDWLKGVSMSPISTDDMVDIQTQIHSCAFKVIRIHRDIRHLASSDSCSASLLKNNLLARIHKAFILSSSLCTQAVAKKHSALQSKLEQFASFSIGDQYDCQILINACTQLFSMAQVITKMLAKARKSISLESYEIEGKVDSEQAKESIATLETKLEAILQRVEFGATSGTTLCSIVDIEVAPLIITIGQMLYRMDCQAAIPHKNAFYSALDAFADKVSCACIGIVNVHALQVKQKLENISTMGDIITAEIMEDMKQTLERLSVVGDDTTNFLRATRDLFRNKISVDEQNEEKELKCISQMSQREMDRKVVENMLSRSIDSPWFRTMTAKSLSVPLRACVEGGGADLPDDECHYLALAVADYVQKSQPYGVDFGSIERVMTPWGRPYYMVTVRTDAEQVNTIAQSVIFTKDDALGFRKRAIDHYLQWLPTVLTDIVNSYDDIFIRRNCADITLIDRLLNRMPEKIISRVFEFEDLYAKVRALNATKL